MALVKFGGGITQMSGSIAGNTFARNRYGNYVRSRTKPVNPNSTSQGVARSSVSFLTARWHDTLTAAQRVAWGTYANAVAMKNKLGETTYLSGFNHYIRSNAQRKQNALSTISAGPTTLALPGKDTTLAIQLNAAAQQISVVFDNTLPWAAETGSYMLLYMGSPQLATRNFFAGPWKYAGKISGATGSAPTSPQVINAPFTITAGQKVWCYATIVMLDGRVTEKMFCSSTTALSYTSTGVTVPTSTGVYLTNGLYNNKATAFCTAQSLYIWWDGIDSWIMSTAPGTLDAGYWKRTDPQIIGTYTHTGTATGGPVLSLTV